MKILQAQRRRGFTVVEWVVIAAVVVVVLAVGLRMAAISSSKCCKLGCENNLREFELSLRIWEGDNNDKYPMEVPVALGGAQELIATGNVAGCFQVMSNELSAPKILTCPEDRQHEYATNWNISRRNISYFIGLNATNSVLPVVLSGDANLRQNGQVVAAGKVNLWSNSVSWTRDRHHGLIFGVGNILLPDGSVQTVPRMGFTSSAGSWLVTNTVVVP